MNTLPIQPFDDRARFAPRITFGRRQTPPGCKPDRYFFQKAKEGGKGNGRHLRQPGNPDDWVANGRGMPAEISAANKMIFQNVNDTTMKPSPARRRRPVLPGAEKNTIARQPAA